jgi:hypothetical protein
LRVECDIAHDVGAKLVLYLLALRERLREVRAFFRSPLRVSFATSADASTARVLLYGVPFADWNATLSDGALWRDVKGVAGVWRRPALPILAALIAGPPGIVIPIKTGHARRLPRGWRALVPNDASIQALGNKIRFAAYMAAHGFGDACPITYAGPADAVFPCVLKLADRSASWGVVVAHSRAELDALLESPTYHGRAFTLQALVPGPTEYATYCVCKDGAILWHCTFVTEVAGPETIKSEDTVLSRCKIETPAPIVRAIERVLAPLAYSGPCNLDYKLAPDGTIRIFEINPRLGGTLVMPQYGAELKQALNAIVANAR